MADYQRRDENKEDGFPLTAVSGSPFDSTFTPPAGLALRSPPSCRLASGRRRDGLGHQPVRVAGNPEVPCEERLGEGALAEEEVFAPGRDSVMRPHFIRPLVARGRFATYQQGREWFHANAGKSVVVPKPGMAEAIGMVHEAGGETVLAHPGYYWKDGFPILEELASLRALGLDGVELDYPYASSSPELFPDGDSERFVASLRAAGRALSLRFTRGSDAHSPADLDRVYGTPPARPAKEIA